MTITLHKTELNGAVTVHDLSSQFYQCLLLTNSLSAVLCSKALMRKKGQGKT